MTRLIHTLTLVTILIGVRAQAESPEVKKPGRPVKVAAICTGFGGERQAKLALATQHLHAAGKAQVDIACLPEEFAGMQAERI